MLPIYLNRQLKSLAWWKWIVIIDLILISITALAKYNPNLPVLHYFNLGLEMNFAAWWSSMNLLLAAVLSYELFCSQKNGTKNAWLVISFVLCALSWDELGSLHERVFQGSWSNYIPYGLVGIGLTIYALIKLFSQPNTRKSAFLILIAFILFAFVALQEYIEHAVEWSDWLVGIRVGVEEGTELLAIFLYLLAIILQRKGQQRTNNLLTLFPNFQTIKHWSIILLIGVIVHSATSLYLPQIPELYLKGNPAIWYPSVVFFILFLHGIDQYCKSSEDQRKIWLLLAVNFLLFSAFICAQAPKGSFTKFYLLYGIQLLLIPLFYVKLNHFKLNLHIVFLSYLPFLLLLSSLVGGLVAPFLISGIFTYLVAQIFLFNHSLASLETNMEIPVPKLKT